MMISRAFRPACTRAFGPIVSRCSWHSTVPSTSPSIVRSSRAKIWPLTVTFLPKAADPPRVEGVSGSKVLDGDDMVCGSLLCVSTVGCAGGAGTPAGLWGCCGSSSSLRLLHMKQGSPGNGSFQSYYCRTIGRTRRYRYGKRLCLPGPQHCDNGGGVEASGPRIAIGARGAAAPGFPAGQPFDDPRHGA